MEKKYYIYKTTNLINGKQYIGKHIGEINDDYFGSGLLITDAIKKYGKENFQKEILCLCQNEEELNDQEKYYINLYNAILNKNFYNIADGGQGGYVTKGYTKKQREDVNKKISQAISGEKHPMYGKHWDNEHKEYLREKSLEYWTEERKRARSEQYFGEKNPMYGKNHTEESRKKMSETQKYNFLKTDEYKELLKKLKSMPIQDEDKSLIKRKTVKVKMYDYENNFIRDFNTKNSVLKFLNISNATHLNEAIKNNTLYKGFYWKVDKV